MRFAKRPGSTRAGTPRAAARHGGVRGRLTLRRRLTLLAAAASIVLTAVPLLGSTVSASTLSDVPDGTTQLVVDPAEATIAPNGSHLFTVGAYDDGGGFLGDVSGANGVDVYIANGPEGATSSCGYDQTVEAWSCTADTTGDYDVVATYNGGGGCAGTALAPTCGGVGAAPLATPGYVADGSAILHVVEGGGTGSTTTTCSGTSCNTDPLIGDPGNPDAVDNLNRLTLGGGSDVTVTADFIPGDAVVSRCGSSSGIGDAVDVRLYGSDLGSVYQSMTTIIIIPMATLVAAGAQRRPLDKFDVCLGAAYLPGDGTADNAWLSKHQGKPKLVPAAGPEFDGTFQRYWGIAANCRTKGLSPSDPCVVLRTKKAKDLYKVAPWAKAAGLMHDGDVAIVFRTVTPWDGKGGVYTSS